MVKGSIFPLAKVTIIRIVWFENKVHKAITCYANYAHQPVSAQISFIPESHLKDDFMRSFPATSWNLQDAAQWASISPWETLVFQWQEPGWGNGDHILDSHAMTDTRNRLSWLLEPWAIEFLFCLFPLTNRVYCLIMFLLLGNDLRCANSIHFVFIMHSFFPFLYVPSNADQTDSPFTPCHHSLIWSALIVKIIKLSHRNTLSAPQYLHQFKNHIVFFWPPPQYLHHWSVGAPQGSTHLSPIWNRQAPILNCRTEIWTLVFYWWVWEQKVRRFLERTVWFLFVSLWHLYIIF